jgi:protease-4
MDRIYQGFVTRVAQGRRLPVDRVMEIAKGHVWTGAQAKDLGLVDEIGGYQVAVQRAEALAGLHGDVRVKPFTSTQSPFAALLRLLGGGGGEADSARLLLGANAVSSDPVTRDLMETLHQAHLRAEGATVLAPIMPFSGG